MKEELDQIAIEEAKLHADLDDQKKSSIVDGAKGFASHFKNIDGKRLLLSTAIAGSLGAALGYTDFTWFGAETSSATFGAASAATAGATHAAAFHAVSEAAVESTLEGKEKAHDAKEHNGRISLAKSRISSMFNKIRNGVSPDEAIGQLYKEQTGHDPSEISDRLDAVRDEIGGSTDPEVTGRKRPEHENVNPAKESKSLQNILAQGSTKHDGNWASRVRNQSSEPRIG